jgi:hypothetical protein
MRAKGVGQIAFICVIVIASIGVFAAAADAQSNCTGLRGTITGQFVPAGPEGTGWYAHAYLSLGKDETVLAAKLLDQNDGYKDHPTFTDPSGNFAGDEVLMFTIAGAGTFQMKGHFIGVAGTTPYAYQFNETGKIAAGTGDFAGMTGSLSIHGSFVTGGGLAAGPSEDHPWVWIAQMTGTVCRAQ